MILGAAAATLSFGAFAQESSTGTITRLDEARGMIAISQVQGTTGSNAGSAAQEYKAQDGLVFNGFKEGDKVSFAFEHKDGVKTLTKLQKE
jgi:Cu/Ag efflux protein CusF